MRGIFKPTDMTRFKNVKFPPTSTLLRDVSPLPRIESPTTPLQEIINRATNVTPPAYKSAIPLPGEAINTLPVSTGKGVIPPVKEPLVSSRSPTPKAPYEPNFTLSKSPEFEGVEPGKGLRTVPKPSKIDVAGKMGESTGYTPKTTDTTLTNKMGEGAGYNPQTFDPYTGKPVGESGILNRVIGGAKNIGKNLSAVGKTILADPVNLGMAAQAADQAILNKQISEGDVGVGSAIRFIRSGMQSIPGMLMPEAAKKIQDWSHRPIMGTQGEQTPSDAYDFSRGTREKTPFEASTSTDFSRGARESRESRGMGAEARIVKDIGEALPPYKSATEPGETQAATSEAGKVATEPGKTQTAATPEAGPVFKGGRLTGVPETAAGTAALQNTMQPYSRSSKPGDVGKPTNTLGINTGFGGQGTIQWADNRKLSPEQQANLAATIQNDSDPLAQQKRKESAALANQNLARAGGNNQQAPIQQVVMPGGGEEGGFQHSDIYYNALDTLSKKTPSDDYFGAKALTKDKAASEAIIRGEDAQAQNYQQGILARQNQAMGYQQHLDTLRSTQGQNAAQNALKEKEIEATREGSAATRDLAEQNAASLNDYRSSRIEQADEALKAKEKGVRERSVLSGEKMNITEEEKNNLDDDFLYKKKFREQGQKPGFGGHLLGGKNKEDIAAEETAHIGTMSSLKNAIGEAIKSGESQKKVEAMVKAYETRSGAKFRYPE